jgi:hypothetical protein
VNQQPDGIVPDSVTFPHLRKRHLLPENRMLSLVIPPPCRHLPMAHSRKICHAAMTAIT